MSPSRRRGLRPAGPRKLWHIALACALALGLTASASAAEGPFPVWWSPALELDSLDAIDARLERALWTYESDGMPLIKSEGDTRIEVWANSCNDLERLIEEGHSAAGSHDYWVQQYQLAVCRAIEMMRRATPARRTRLLARGRNPRHDR